MDFIGDDVVKALLLTLLLFFEVVLVVCSDLVVFYAHKIGHLKYGLS